MSPEGHAYLSKARQSLSDGHYLLVGDRFHAAARAAYYAGYHAALALIFEHTGRTVKTHSGARSEFSRLTHGLPGFDSEVRRFLAEIYVLKNAADYATGSAGEVSREEAAGALTRATRLIEAVERADAESVERTTDTGEETS